VNDVRMSTDTVSERERLAYWRDAVCDTFVELECDTHRPAQFFGSLTSKVAGAIQYSAVRSAPQHVARTRHKISRSGHDYFLLSLQTRGQGVLEQGGRRAVLQTGDFALYDTTRPYDLWFDAQFSQLVLRLPRQMVAQRLFDADRFTALRIAGGVGAGRLASLFFRQLYHELERVEPGGVDRLHAAGVDLLATAFAEQTGALSSVSESHAMLQRRICDFIDRHLSDPDLSCLSIASVHGISERYLRKLFARSSTSASDQIWTRRLERAKHDLVDPLQAHRTVTAIGYDVGFKDAAHFSRAFKSRFGITPTEWRRNALSMTHT
jgi:AraC-like DNA-binding protein